MNLGGGRSLYSEIFENQFPALASMHPNQTGDVIHNPPLRAGRTPRIEEPCRFKKNPDPASPITDSGIARIDVSDFHSKLTEYTTPSPLLFRPQLSRR